MLLITNLLFELQVYRIDESTYYKKFSEFRDSRSNEVTSPDHPCHLANFGGQWEYNEIIGFLKFYVSGKTQIRCEYVETNAKKKVKTRKKMFIRKSDSFSVRNIDRSMTNENIIEIIDSSIEHCKKNLAKNRFIKTDVFFSTYKYTDWHKAIYSN